MVSIWLTPPPHFVSNRQHLPDPLPPLQRLTCNMWTAHYHYHTGGWWYRDWWGKECTHAHLTGQNTKTKTNYNIKSIFYGEGREGGISYESWAEAEMLLLPF